MSTYKKLPLPYRNKSIIKKLPLPYNRNKSIKKVTRPRPLPLIPPPIEIPTIFSHVKTPNSWKKRQDDENKRLYYQSKETDEFIRLFEILKTKTDKFNHSYFETIQFLYVQAPGIIMRILNECVSDVVSDDIKIKIIGLIIVKTFSLYIEKSTEYVENIEREIDIKYINCINEKIKLYSVLKKPDWSLQMKTKKSTKKSFGKSKKKRSKKKRLGKSKKSR